MIQFYAKAIQPTYAYSYMKIVSKIYKSQIMRSGQLTVPNIDGRWCPDLSGSEVDCTGSIKLGYRSPGHVQHSVYVVPSYLEIRYTK